MSLIEEAYKGLGQARELKYKGVLKYSGKFSGYNANVRLYNGMIEFHLSRKWREVSDEIKMGLIQELMCKVLHIKCPRTTNMDLYNIFLKKVHLAIEKTDVEPVLKESFDRVNANFFYGTLDMPNLVWGSESVSRLGSYSYGTDTITMSTILAQDQELLDYVMYHEMLHKKLKFDHQKSRSRHHTTEFRQKEKEFPNSKELEERLKRLLRGKRIKRWWWG